MAEDLSNSAGGNSSTSGNNPLRDSPFGRLGEVLSEEELTNLFSGVGNGQGGGSSFGGGGSQPDLAYGGNPFAGDNFWNIFAGGVNPSAGGGRPSTGGGNDPLTGGGSSSTGGISTTEIPDGFSLRATIDKLIDSRLDNELGDGQIPSFGSGQTPSFGSGQTPSFGSGQTPSFGGGQTPSFGGQTPSFGGGQTPSFGGGQSPFA
jgi:hypothetical protein